MRRDELFHSSVYYGKDVSDGIRHYKYIDKYKSKSGKWVYIYKKNRIKNPKRNDPLYKTKYNVNKLPEPSKSNPSYKLGSNVDETVKDYLNNFLNEQGLIANVLNPKSQTMEIKQYSISDIKSVSVERKHSEIQGMSNVENYYQIIYNTKDGNRIENRLPDSAITYGTDTEKKSEKKVDEKIDSGKTFIDKILNKIRR